MKNLAAGERDGMSSIVQTVTHWVAPFVILYGLFGLAAGHRNPGGAFESGVILACGAVLLMLALGKPAVTSRLLFRAVPALASIGVLIFWAVAVSGMFLSPSKQFFKNFLLEDSAAGGRTGGIIPICEVGIALTVTAALTLVLVSLAVLRVKAHGPDEEFVTDIEE